MNIDLLRPSDLLALRIEPRNLRLDKTNRSAPKLLVDKKGSPAYLIVHFPPQTILERAYFEDATIPAPPPAAGDDPIDLPGSAPSRIAGESRIVLRVPSSVKEIPYTIAGLLDWSKFELVVSPAAQGKPGSLVAPTALQTALEIPYRVLLSPDADTGWLHATEPAASAGRTELWHTRLAKTKKVTVKGQASTVLVEASDKSTVPVRAIWSPDLPGTGPLPTGESPFRAAMSASDRAQVVILSSGTNGYYVLDDQRRSVAYVPQPVAASRLFLSALGGWLSSRGSWPQPPNYNLADGRIQALDLVEWTHLATLCRDHYVRIVYDGFLYPFGHKASLIKVTERKVVTPGVYGAVTITTPTAYLKQRMYIVVREKEKSYSAASFPHGGRELPFASNITIKTQVTPDIDLPPAPQNSITPGGKSFWVNTGGAAFPFHVRAQDLTGATFDFLAPLIFMDAGESAPATIVSAYANSGGQRACSVPGARIAYAPPSAGDTVLKTSQLFFTSALLETAPPYTGDPFVPTLDHATVEVPAIEELLGSATGVDVSLYGDYLAHGLDVNAGVFAQVLGTPPSIGFTADKAGGFATPVIALTALSARKGVVAGSPADAAAGKVQPTAFFDISAQLFGTVPLQALIPVDANGKAPAAQNAPEIRAHTSPSLSNPQKVVTTMAWSPALQHYPTPPWTNPLVSVTFGAGAALTLNTKITRDLSGGPGGSEISGKLTSFTVTLAQVIGVSFDALSFSSKNGSKTNVRADLPSGGTNSAIVFSGPLNFVQTLAEILPPGIFGAEGPSIDLAPDHVSVTLTIGLPPISIGVLLLEHISIMTGLDLPYIEGKPAFEFAFASRGSPFLITVECLGGGGFVHLIVDTDGVQMVEGALEFGGKFAFDIGVASGGIHAMAGIYFQLKSDFTDLTGFVDLGGEVSVLGIISISIDLNLSLSYQVQGNKKVVQGRATLTVSIHILFFSASVQLSVEKSFGSSAGDPSIKQVVAAADWAAYAAAFA
jgi:hypothetical protein